MKKWKLYCAVLVVFLLGVSILLFSVWRQKSPSQWKDITSVQVLNFFKRHGVLVRWLTIDNAGEFGLDLEASDITDLRILRGMPVKSLIIANTDVRDLSPLREIRNLKMLNVAGTAVSDLTPLKSLALLELSITLTKVSDLSPLTNMPLKVLSMIQTDIHDLTPLCALPLEEIYFSADDARLEGTINVLREKQSLRCINYYGSVAEFWADYDAGVFKRSTWVPQNAPEDMNLSPDVVLDRIPPPSE